MSLSEWTKLTFSLLTPLVILFLGIHITRRLEMFKAGIATERDWARVWASSFLEATASYQRLVSRYITVLHQLARMNPAEQQKVADRRSMAEPGVRQSLGSGLHLPFGLLQFCP